MQLRTLGYFLAVSDAGSVTAAARAVHVTQPSLSRQLRSSSTTSASTCSTGATAPTPPDRRQCWCCLGKHPALALRPPPGW